MTQTQERYLAQRTLSVCLGLLIGTQAVVCRADGPVIDASGVTSAAVAAAQSCGEYRVVGVCVWLVCTLKCKVRTTVKIGHYIPDVVVSAYANSKESPFVSSQPVVNRVAGVAGNLLGMTLGGGSAVNGDSGKDEQNPTRFKIADVVGSPAVAMYGQANCPSVAQAMRPYFVGDADYLGWRAGVPEVAYPDALNPLARNIKMGMATWGSVYPRQGWIAQAHDYKAAAVIAQRAGDITTRSGQPHVYSQIGGGGAGRWERWPPGALTETQAKTGKWQMLVPRQEKSCYVFPDVDDTALGVDPHAPRNTEFGNYAWHLWRPYSCCSRPKNAVRLLSSTGSYP